MVTLFSSKPVLNGKMKMKLRSLLVAAASLALSAGTVLAAEAPSTIGATYRDSSITEALAPGEKIANLFTRSLAGEVIVQKLTDRVYFYQSGFYGTSFYVGNEGVLLFDPLEYRAEPILAAIRSVTNLPVTAIVYSHNHADHIGGTPALLALLSGQATPPRLIASQETADKMARLNSSLPRPSETVAWPRGSFAFEGLTVELHGFAHAGHTDDHSAWLLREERVLHAPDLLNPDQPPFWSFAGSERFLYLTDNLREANALAWDHFNGGHGNVGSHADFAFHLAFIDDLVAEVRKAMGEVPWGFGTDPATLTAHTAMLPPGTAKSPAGRPRPCAPNTVRSTASGLPRQPMP